MRGALIALLALCLAACGTQAPAYPATIESLRATATAQATAASPTQAAYQASARQFEALKATATAEALRPTPTITVRIVAPLSETATLSSTASISATAGIANADCGPTPPDAVSYPDAATLIGKVGAVQGRVIKVGRSKKAVFLNFHDPYPGYFSGVIFISAWKQFPGRFEDLYQGRCVRIAGAVKAYDGAPEIVVDSPAQIVVLP